MREMWQLRRNERKTRGSKGNEQERGKWRHMRGKMEMEENQEKRGDRRLYGSTKGDKGGN